MSTEQNPSDKAEGAQLPSVTTPAAEVPTEHNATAEMKAIDAPPLVPSIESPAAEEAGPAAHSAALAADNIKSDAAGEVNSTDELTASRDGAPAAEASLSQSAIPGWAHAKMAVAKLPRRTRWRALMAASMFAAAGIGAAVAAVAMSHQSSSATALLEASTAKERAASKEREQMQLTVAKLNKEVAALKASIESSAKSKSSQIGKLNERLAEKAKDEKAEATRRAAVSSETTGSIGAPASVPVPAPRPQIVEARPSIVDGWSIRSARDGLVLVEGRGEIFEVVPGAPLPGLGRVEDVRRQADGRWVVVTPRGLIVAAARPRAPLYDRY